MPKTPFTQIRNLSRWPAEMSVKADVIQYVYRCNTCKTFVSVDFGANADEVLSQHEHASKNKSEITNEVLQAAFLAARQFGKILDDEVLKAIITAVDAARETK